LVAAAPSQIVGRKSTEGEDHVETLADLAVFLQARGIAVTILQQVAGVLTPDGQFQWGTPRTT